MTRYKPYFQLPGIYVFLLLVLTITCLEAVGQQNNLKFSHLTVDDGLSHTDVKEVVQDKLGFIWIATLYGLDRYDGHEIKKFYNTTLAKNFSFKNRIRSMCLDEHDRLWLGSEDGIQYFDPHNEQYTNVDNQQHDTGKKTYTRLIAMKGDLLVTLAVNQLRLFKTRGQVLQNITVHYPADLKFSDMVAGLDGNIWLSSNKGLWLLDRSFTLRHVDLDHDKKLDRLLKVFRNRREQLIVVSGTNLILTKQTPVVPSGNDHPSTLIVEQQRALPGCSIILGLVQDKNFNYWVCTDGGLFLLDQNLNIKQLITSQSFVNSLNTNYLDKIFIDRSDCLWVCTFGAGLNFCDLNAKMFYTIQRNPEVANTLSGNHIRSILEESKDIVWLGTNSNGLNQYDFTTKKFVHFNKSSSKIKLKSNEVDALELDRLNNLWIGNEQGIDIINRERTGLIKYPEVEKYMTHSVASLSRDYYGNMWFGSYYNGYGNIVGDKKNHFKVNYQGSGSGYVVYAEKDKPEVLVSSIMGFQRLLIDSLGNIIRRFRYQVNDRPNSLSSDYIFPVQKQNDSAYWVGTIGGGLNYLSLSKNSSYHVKIYDGHYGVFNDVESMQLDDHGNVWMGGNGLERFDVKTKRIRRFDKNDGLQSNSFKVGASYKGWDGRLYFGGINGVNYFYPDSIKTNKIAAHPTFTDLLINNKRSRIGKSLESDHTIPLAIPYSAVLVLNYLQNNFVISFSAMHYANAEKCLYRYKLLGFDKEWKYTDGKNPTAAYTNLNYKDYTLVLEATNNDGLWSADRAELHIAITAPWWKSTFAYVVYLLLMSSVLVGIYIYQARWFRLKKELAVRDVEESKREEMHLQREEFYQQQLQFFTNISHEFRTPLTLILGPLESLLLENAGTVYSHTLQLMHRNAKRLINLINELMNFRKVAENAVVLHVAPLNVNDFVGELYEEFRGLADKNKIEFILKISDAETFVYLDRQIAEKILLNLLNNAFKYTKMGGRITLEVFSDINCCEAHYPSEFRLMSGLKAPSYLYFRIADTGIGISPESISQIFDRYYRINNHHIGSGIGLALVKNLTLLHKGDILVSSERNLGTEIIIGLPDREQSYEAKERMPAESDQAMITLEELDHSVGMDMESAGQPFTNSDSEHTHKQHILLVEDNDELRLFLKGVLEKKYVVYEAVNGKQGLDIAIESVPDLIISDVMMPVMNGVEFCRLIKASFETSHIPFLFLSAKSALGARLEGLESGADFYIAKPVSIELLMLTVYNLFEQKRKLKLKYTEDYYAEATELVHSVQDKEFLDKLIGLIEANIERPDLDIEYLCNHMYTSRSKLYKKVKSISGQSINEFIRGIRLKKAAYLMTHEDITQNEIIERIGILSVSYFQKAFRKKFGKTPSQFIQSLKQ